MKKFIAIEDLAHDLGLLQSDVNRWITDEQAEITNDFRGRPSVDVVLKDKLSKRVDYLIAFKRSLSSDSNERTTSILNNETYKQQRLSLLREYDNYIKELQEIYEFHLEKINSHKNDGAVRAAYLLFSKAITCLEMGCKNLEAGYWYSGSIIREIDETIDLALYFIIEESSEEGQKNLQKWFRQNYAPKHAICREVIAEYSSNLIGDFDKENHRQLMNELYQKKSKWVHPTFNVIREISVFDENNEIELNAVSTGVTDNEGKLLELTDYFRSSIWTVYQVFGQCFMVALPLDEEVKSRLLEIDTIFAQWEAV